MDSGTYNVALVVHLLGALTFVAGIVLAGAAFEAARHRERPAEIALLLGLARIGVLLVAVGTLVLAVFGLWLVHLGNWGYGGRLGSTHRSVCSSRRWRSVLSEVNVRSRRAAWRLSSRGGTRRSARSCRGCSTTASR